MRKKRAGVIVRSIIGIALVIATIVLGVQYSQSSGIFYKPGELILDESLSTKQQDFIRTNLANTSPAIELKHNVTISSTKSQTLETSTSQLIYNIYVPVTDFYNPINSISSAEVSESAIVPILDLTPQQKLLAIDNQYYLDTLNSGAIFEYLTFTGEVDDITKITAILQPELPTFPTSDTVLTFAQTGVTALSRGMNAKLTQVGDATYFTKNIADFLSSFDLTHTSNESSFTTYANSKNICSLPAMVDVLTSIGLDIVELTGNHNQDCGDEAALDTLTKYTELGIKTVGGGATAAQAAEPLLIEQKGNHITMLAYNLSTGGYTLDNTPGANFYTREKAMADITAAKERGDTIIVDIQYYECNAYDNTADSRTCDYANSAAGDQINFFRELVDMGADVVIGTAAHQPQTYELYNGKAIYYGLGNLFFDQIWWPGTTRSLILVHYFYDNRLVQTRIMPTVYDDSMQTMLMDNAAATAFIERLNQARPQQ